jgi:hypothetical protein
LELIKKAILDFPRFENDFDGFDNAFVAAHKIFSKTYGGDVHLTHRHIGDDFERRLEACVKDNAICVKVYGIDYGENLHVRGREMLAYLGNSVEDYFIRDAEYADDQDIIQMEQDLIQTEYEKNSRGEL